MRVAYFGTRFKENIHYQQSWTTDKDKEKKRPIFITKAFALRSQKHKKIKEFLTF